MIIVHLLVQILSVSVPQVEIHLLALSSTIPNMVKALTFSGRRNKVIPQFQNNSLTRVRLLGKVYPRAGWVVAQANKAGEHG